MRLNRANLFPYYFLLLFLLLIVLSFLSSLNDQSPPETNQIDLIEKELNQRLVSIQQQLNNFDLMNKRRKSEIFYLQKLVQNLRNKNNETNLLNDFNLIVNEKVTDQTNLNFLNNVNKLSSNYLDLPSIKQFLPYLDHNLSTLDPSFVHSSKKIRQDAEIVFGIPTVKRPKESYLLLTMKNLIDNLDDIGKNNSLFVIMIAETDIEYVKAVSAKLEERFKQYIDNGLIEIISTPSNYYPNFDMWTNDQKDPMGDSLVRVKWRSKQNLDYAYLMMYCKNRGSFYMQLEDDIISIPNYYNKIKQFVYTQQIRRPNQWLVIQFSYLGFIGKLFRSNDLSLFISFFLMFYKDKPVDWLLENLLRAKYCRIDASFEDCKLQISKHRLLARPPLFQHLGLYSSLKGKIQKLKENTFSSKKNLFFAHSDNPEAKLSTDLIIYKTFDLESAYNGDNFCWALSPRKGNYIQIEFVNPIIVDQYKIKTGNWNHPLDTIYNSTLSIKPLFILSETMKAKYKMNENGNYIVNEFLINKGEIEGSLKEFGAITLMRIDFKSNLDNWVLISEIMIRPKLN